MKFCSNLIIRRVTALFCLFFVLVTSCAAGIMKEEPEEVKAVAVVDDLVAFLAEYISIMLTTSLSAGGYSNDEILTPAEEAGITNVPDAEDYVHNMFSGNDSFLKYFSLDNAEFTFQWESCLAATWLAAGVVIDASLWDKVLNPSPADLAEWGFIPEPTDIDADYNPNEEPWDPEKWKGLTEQQKLGFLHLADLRDGTEGKIMWDPLEGKWIIKGREWQEFLRKAAEEESDNGGGGSDGGDGGDSGGDNGGDNGGDKIPPVNDFVMGLMVTTPVFHTIYNMAKASKVQDVALKLSDKKTDSTDCDYSVSYWSKNPRVLTVSHEDFSLPYGDTAFFEFYTKDDIFPQYCQNFAKLDLNDKIYPLVYYKENKPYFCFANTNEGNRIDEISILGNTRNKYNNPETNWFPRVTDYGTDMWRKGKTFDFSMGDMGFPVNGSNLFNGDIVNQAVLNRSVLDPGRVRVISPDLIDCGTYDNVEKFRQHIESGDYTLDDILECMADGWKGKKNKGFKGVDDNGETVKKVLKSPEGKKYKKKVTATDEDGNEKEKEVVTFESFIDGISQTKAEIGESVGVHEILGDIGDDVIVKMPFPDKNDNPSAGDKTDPDNPTNPDPDPGKDPGTNPDPDPGKDPGTNPDPDPGKDPGTDPDSPDNPNDPGNPDKPGDPDKPDDIDPEEVKTPELLKKFPFCVPWDLVALVENLSAEKTPPKFTLPFSLNKKDFKLDEEITIDFSRFEEQAKICRWFFRLIYILSLVLLTRQIIKG